MLSRASKRCGASPSQVVVEKKLLEGGARSTDKDRAAFGSAESRVLAEIDKATTKPKEAFPVDNDRNPSRRSDGQVE